MGGSETTKKATRISIWNRFAEVLNIPGCGVDWMEKGSANSRSTEDGWSWATIMMDYLSISYSPVMTHDNQTDRAGHGCLFTNPITPQRNILHNASFHPSTTKKKINILVARNGFTSCSTYPLRRHVPVELQFKCTSCYNTTGVAHSSLQFSAERGSLEVTCIGRWLIVLVKEIKLQKNKKRRTSCVLMITEV